MQNTQLIVWEPTRHWVVHLRRQMAVSADRFRAIQIHQARTEQTCEAMIARWPACVVAATVSVEQLGERLRWFAELRRRFPNARCVAMVDPQWRQFEAPIRESGALEVVYRVGQLEEVLEMVLRRRKKSPTPELTLTNRIWASLPWSEELA